MVNVHQEYQVKFCGTGCQKGLKVQRLDESSKSLLKTHVSKIAFQDL